MHVRYDILLQCSTTRPDLVHKRSVKHNSAAQAIRIDVVIWNEAEDFACLPVTTTKQKTSALHAAVATTA